MLMIMGWHTIKKKEQFTDRYFYIRTFEQKQKKKQENKEIMPFS